MFDHVAFDQQANTAFYEVDSEEGHWTSGQGFQRRGEGLAALGYKNRSQEGYFPAPPNDTLSDLRQVHPDADLYFITGADALTDILGWRSADALLPAR